MIEYALFGRSYKNFICGKFLSILVGMGVTVVLFYTYLGIYGKNVDAINIIIYFIAMASAYLFGYRFIYIKQKNCHYPALCLAGLIILLLLFWVFTVFPPELPLFVSP
jgi:phosphatidylserine synthase